MRVIALEPDKFETDLDKVRMETAIKASPESRQEWSDKLDKLCQKGRNGRMGASGGKPPIIPVINCVQISSKYKS